MLFRRQFLLGLALAAVPGGLTPWAKSTSFQHPPPTAFESGDLLWTAEKDAIIPYSSDAAFSRWRQARDEYLKRARGRTTATHLPHLSYDEFRELFFYGREQQGRTPYAGVIGVGHVAILSVEGSRISVIEARPESLSLVSLFDSHPNGVIEQDYDMWIKALDNYNVWHGRVRNLHSQRRSNIPVEARRFIGQPYDFWNFDLDDSSGFYCSKLVWLSVINATGVAIDGETAPSRSIWLSPKQILNQHERIKLINLPGAYGGR